MENFILTNKEQNALYNQNDNQILLTFDKNMIIHALNTMYSFVRFNKNISFICMCDELNNEQVLQLLQNDFGVIVYQYKLNKSLDTKHWTIVSTYRLFTPWLLPNTIKKILYVDSDVLCKEDVSELFNIPNEFPIALCDDLCVNILGNSSITTFSIYYNSGVLVYNLDYMRQNFNGSEFFKIFADNVHKYKYPDQDFINEFFNKDGRQIYPLIGRTIE